MCNKDCKCDKTESDPTAQLLERLVMELRELVYAVNCVTDAIENFELNIEQSPAEIKLRG